MLESFRQYAGIAEDKAIMMIIKDDEELQDALITVFKKNMRAYDTIINTLNDPSKNLAVSNYRNVCVEKIKGLFMTDEI